MPGTADAFRKTERPQFGERNGVRANTDLTTGLDSQLGRRSGIEGLGKANLQLTWRGRRTANLPIMDQFAVLGFDADDIPSPSHFGRQCK